MAVSLATLRNRRGRVRASLTRLTSKIAELETKETSAAVAEQAKQLLKRLETLDSEFKTHQHAIMDELLDETELGVEQEAIDQHDDKILDITMKLEALARPLTSILGTPSLLSDRTVMENRIAQLESRLTTTRAGINALSGDPSALYMVHVYQEKLSDLKAELAGTRNEMMAITADITDPLNIAIQTQDEAIFEMMAKVNKLLYNPLTPDAGLTLTSGTRSVRLPKIDVPTFNGDLLSWQTFWEQFGVSVHERKDITNTEKLVYLRHSLKGGSAKTVIEGLSHTGDQYKEAVESLKARYDRPRIIHQAHVRKICEVPNLKNGSGKEIRQFHDTVQQHLRALKSMDEDPTGSFITALLELKLDKDTMFEWQKASQSDKKTPHYQDLLEFLSLRAQAAETCSSENRKHSFKHEVKRQSTSSKVVASHTASCTPSTAESVSTCVVCKSDKHPLYSCSKFKELQHDKMFSIVKDNNLCLNCLKPGHVSRNCSSTNRCKRCQRPHHTLLHKDTNKLASPSKEGESVEEHVSTTIQAKLISNTLLMTCQVLVHAPDGSTVRARGLLDSGSSVSFISECLAQSLKLQRKSKSIHISGIAGISHHSPIHSVAMFEISPLTLPQDKLQLTAVIVSRVTRDLPLQPISWDSNWSHLDGLYLSDPDFGRPGKIDILLGVDVYTRALMHGRRSGLPGLPVAIETKFGWVLAGQIKSTSPSSDIVSHHATLTSGDDLIRQFWEIEESPMDNLCLSPEEKAVVRHFNENHSHHEDGSFVVPLPRNLHVKPLGESRSQAVRRFLSLERSLHAKNQFSEFSAVIEEYFEMQHAELVPKTDLDKPNHEVFYLPMHAVRKEHSTTTKIRAVFDASAKSSTGISLNDTLLVGPTVHSSLIDVLLRFRWHRIALTTDVSKMYRAVRLASSDSDFHRFVWRKSPDEPLTDYRMTRVTFGVSASPFAANMAVQQNAVNHAAEFPLAAQAVKDSFYVDDGLSGATSIEEAITLQHQLQNLFAKGGFLLRKWKCSDPQVLSHLSSDLIESVPTQLMPASDQYVKTLGIEWNSTKDYFRLTISKPPPPEDLTKRQLVSDIAKTYDVLGWFSPTIIKAKILLQRLWEQKVGWDDSVPVLIRDAWVQWRSELHLLSDVQISRYYFSGQAFKAAPSVQLHGFSDASEEAYAAVVYILSTDGASPVKASLVMSKTKVAPIKRLTTPRLELCGAHLLARLLDHIRRVLLVPLSHVHAWTDSTVVLNWLDGNPRRFKTYVGNRVSSILQLIPPDRWKHVRSTDNPADCASRGVFPSELVQHHLWWNGPTWLSNDAEEWPKQESLPPISSDMEWKEVSLHTITPTLTPIISASKFSNFEHLKRITAWVLRFVTNSRLKCASDQIKSHLTAEELQKAECYWFSIVQQTHFGAEIKDLTLNKHLSKASPLVSLQPFLDNSGLLRVGGRQRLSKLSYTSKHPIIVHGSHQLIHILIFTEHLRLLHAGPTLVMASLGRRVHIVGGRKTVRSVIRKCYTCRRYSAKPQAQILGQLPIERTTPGPIFEKVGVDYAGPLLIKYGYTRKPVIVKAYVSVFVSLTVKAVHLELVTDLTSDAFIAALKRFIARRGLPSLIWSDNGTNFVGAQRELRELYQFLESHSTQESIAAYLSKQNITWKFNPPHAPHFGGLWEAAVKSMKTHLKRILGDVKLTYEELATVITQIESCLNSRPLAPLPNDEDGIEALTPGHFIIGQPLKALPEVPSTEVSMSLLRRWQLCKALLRHFWKRWSSEYLTHLSRYSKWRHPNRNLHIGDIVVIREDSPITNQWPLGKIVEVHPGEDGVVRVVTIKTASGVYKRPVVKLALLLPIEEH